jgi:glycosyltransferase involved in cell wall biosynthesis
MNERVVNEKAYIRPTIGVVLCTYNGERYLRTQLESIIAQSRQPDMLLACDDASLDGTIGQLEACAELASFHFRIVRNNENLGYLRNFELAIRRCDADIIVLSDQDDWWRPDKLEKLEAVFLSDAQAAAVFSDADIVNDDLKSLGFGVLDAQEVNETERALAESGRLFPVLLRHNVVCGATLALRASWRERVFPIPAGFVHDEWIGLVIAAHEALRFIPDPLIRYRQHGANQIGLRRWTQSQRLRRLIRLHRPDAEKLVTRMLMLQERLSGISVASGALNEVESKIEHLRRRLSLRKELLTRPGAVVGEIMNGRYARYSSGWRSALRDLVAPI